MTVVAHPLDAVSGSPLFTSQQIRQTGSVLHGTGSGTPLGARDGFRIGTGSVLSVSGLTWRVAPCSGVLDTGATVTGDPYEWAVTAQESGAVAAADANNPRIDVVYLRIADNAVDSAGTAAAFVEYRAGTPGSAPVAPTVMADGTTPLTRGLVIGPLAVPAAGGGNPTAITNRQYVTAAGARLPVANSDAYPTNPHVGMQIFDLTLNYGLTRTALGGGSYWSPDVVIVRETPRPTPDNGLYDGFTSANNADYRPILADTWAAAAAGVYLLELEPILSAPNGPGPTYGSAGNIRMQVNGATINGNEFADLDTKRVRYRYSRRYVHTGGDLTLTGSFLTSTADNRVWVQSLTRMTRLGPAVTV